MRRIQIFDTTLRDGKQTVGVEIPVDLQIQIAKNLYELGVDIIEAGFPAADEVSFEVVTKVAKEYAHKIKIAGFARCKVLDIDKVVETGANMIMLLASVSDRHLAVKFDALIKEITGKGDLSIEAKRAVMLGYFTEQVRYAVSKNFAEVQVYLEDSTRTDISYLVELAKNFIEAGATIITLPDTVGFINDPYQVYERCKVLRNILPRDIKLGFHAHNDKALAVANSLAAVRGGADIIECTINGLGERTGNTDLGHLLLNLYGKDKDRGLAYDYDVMTGINLSKYAQVSRLVSEITGKDIPANYPLMGEFACTTGAGIHQDGVNKDRDTYFTFNPGLFGIGIEGKEYSVSSQMGKRGVRSILKTYGYDPSTEEIAMIYTRIMDLIKQGKRVSKEDLVALYTDTIAYKNVNISFVGDIEVQRKGCFHQISVLINYRGKEIKLEGEGQNGPIDALGNALNEYFEVSFDVGSFHSVSIGEGRDAQVHTEIVLRSNGYVQKGIGLHTDMVESAMFAYLRAFDGLLHKMQNEFDQV